MVAYSFQKRFRDPILAGTKRHTIRADRKRHALPGEELQLYTGMRTKYCRLIARVTCAEIGRIRIDLTGIIMGTLIAAPLTMKVELDAFAVLDGFEDWRDMVAFWKAQHPGITDFRGNQIRWHPIRITPAEII